MKIFLVIVAFLPTVALAANPSAKMDDAIPENRPLLARAVTELYKTCPRLLLGGSGITLIRATDMVSSAGLPAFDKFGWKIYGEVTIRFSDNRAVMPSDVANKYFTAEATYWIGAGPHPGIYPANAGARYACGQRLPWDDNALIQVPALSFLSGLSDD